MTKRQQILELIRIAVREGDHRQAMRLYVENRISHKAFREAIAKARPGLRTMDVMLAG
jgi:hypothetical protein